MNTHLPDKIHLDNAQTFEYKYKGDSTSYSSPRLIEAHGLGREVINTHNYVRRHSKLSL